MCWLPRQWHRMVTAVTSDNAGGASEQIPKHCGRLEKLVAEEWKEWQYQFSVLTNAF